MGDRAADARPARRCFGVEPERLGTQRDQAGAVTAQRPRFDQIGRAHELSGEAGRRVAVDLGRGADLLELAALHQRDAV